MTMNHKNDCRLVLLTAIFLFSAAGVADVFAAEPSLLSENETIMREKRMSTTNPLGLMDPSELPRPYESFMAASPLSGGHDINVSPKSVTNS